MASRLPIPKRSINESFLSDRNVTDNSCGGAEGGTTAAAEDCKNGPAGIDRKSSESALGSRPTRKHGRCSMFTHKIDLKLQSHCDVSNSFAYLEHSVMLYISCHQN